MHSNIVILAGGASSRMKNASYEHRAIDPDLRRQARERAKSMIGVGRQFRPFLDYLLHNVSQAGYSSVVIVVSEQDISVRGYYEEAGAAGQWPQLDISYIAQKIPRDRTTPCGAADALLQALRVTSSWRGQKFTVCNSDNLYSVRALRLLLDDTHRNALIDYDRAALRFDHDRIMKFAVTRTDADGFVVDIIEKPSPGAIADAADASGRIGISMNIFRLDYDMILPVLEAQPFDPARNEKDMPAAINNLLFLHPRSVFAIPLAEHVVDLTSQADISVVSEYLQREFPDL